MMKLLNILKGIIPELIIVASFIAIFNHYIGDTITGDGAGYYEYLPSVFIHHDFVRKNYTPEENQEFLKRVDHFGFYGEQNGKYVNRYACGTAVLELPFFLVTRLITPKNDSLNDGYQKSYHWTIFIAAIFYLFLALNFLKLILHLYQIKAWGIFFSQILMVFATSVTQYATSNAAFSHVYSLFAITAFIYFSKKYFHGKSIKSYLFASLFFGLIIILRQINGLIIFFIPFLAGSWEDLKNGIVSIFKQYRYLLLGVLIFLIVVFIQLLAWYLQSGDWIVYSYKGYGFNFLDPQIVNILFSYKKGLFVYTPILFIGTLGSVYWLIKKQYYLFFSWIGFFVLLTYVLSSWCFWYYGGSFGLRAYIDFYAIFFIPFSISLFNLKKSARILVLIIAVAAIYLNIVQTLQYKAYILHAANMNKERYWKIFLKTDLRYRGIFYLKDFDERKHKLLKEFDLGDFSVDKNSNKEIWSKKGSELQVNGELKTIQVCFDSNFREKDRSRLLLTIDDNDGKNKVYHRPYFLHFAQDDFGEYHTGFYNYILSDNLNLEGCSVKFIVLSSKNGVELNNVKIRLYSSDEN